MAKTAADFLNDLAERELVAESVLASLRRQVAAATRPVSAASIARLLVEKKHLTAVQAERLLGSPLGAAPRAAAAARQAPVPSLTETKPMEPDELGLAPLEEVPAAAASSSQPAASASGALEPLELGPLDLMPLADAPATSSPKAPVTKPQAAPARKPAPSPLPPLEPLGLEPLAGQPLAPLPLDALGPLPAAPQPAPAARPGPARAAAATPAARAPAPLVPPASAAAAAPATGRPVRTTPAIRWIAVAVVALAVCVGGGGIAAWLLLPGGGGENPWQLAQQAYQEKQYAAAVEKYTALLKSQPRHPQSGLARVRLGVARIFAAKGSADWSAALPAAREALAEIDHEPELPQIHPELAPLLSEMATELVQQADEAAADQAPQRLAAAHEALALANNGRYVPGKLRDWQRLAEVQERLAAVERRQASGAALQDFAAAADKSLAAGDLNRFHAERDKLLENHPELAGDQKLREIGQRAAKAAAAAVQPASELTKGATDERPSPILASLILAHPPAATAAGPAGTFVARAGSSVWALDAASGKILWRRPVGSSVSLDPVHLTDRGSVLLRDARHSELVCVNHQTGSLRWRHSFARPIAGPPLVLGDKIFVTDQGGRVTSLSAASGDALAAATLPTAACFGPATDFEGKRLYQLAERDYLYVLSAADLKCKAAVFLGHQAACVDVPPLVAGDRLVVAENHGVGQARLHVIPLDDAGRKESAQALDLPGHVVTLPVVLDRHLLVPTDRGTIVTLELSQQPAEPMKRIGEATMEPGGSWLRFGVAAGNRFFAACQGLTQFDFAPGSGKLTAKWTALPDDVFEGPPQIVGDVLLVVRRPPGGAGWIAAAVKASDGKPLWQSPLAVPLVEFSLEDGGAHVASSSAGAARIALADVAGHKVHELPPLFAGDKQTPIAASIPLAGGRRVLAPAGEPRELLLVDSGGKSRSIVLPDALAGLPAAAAGGLVVPCAGGAVYWLSPEGQLAAGPFQMSMRAGTRLEHCACAAVGASGDRVVISDGRGEVYLLAVETGAAPELKLLATAHLEPPPISPVAALGERAFVVTGGGHLLSLSLPELKPAGSEPLDAREIEFGPARVGDVLLAATDRQELVAIGSDGTIRWKVPCEDTPAGIVAESADSLVVASQEGALERLSAGSGKELARVDLGEPLRGSPVVVEGGVLVATADGVVLTVALPSQQEATP